MKKPVMNIVKTANALTPKNHHTNLQGPSENNNEIFEHLKMGVETRHNHVHFKHILQGTFPILHAI